MHAVLVITQTHTTRSRSASHPWASPRPNPHCYGGYTVLSNGGALPSGSNMWLHARTKGGIWKLVWVEGDEIFPSLLYELFVNYIDIFCSTCFS